MAKSAEEREKMRQAIKKLKDMCSNFGIELDENAEQRFLNYAEMLVDWNTKINLTAITESEQIAVKHFLDSLLLINATRISEGQKLLDVGTGAGFPGVPVKIANPKIKLTLLDSLNKRLIFLDEVMKAIDLEATIIHSRAEEGGRVPELREKFDIVTSRAVASLNLLAEYCLPYVKLGGYFAAMKGPDVEEELCNAQTALSELGGTIEKIEKYTLPDGSKRSIVVIKKIKTISDKYPRHGSKISKKPL